jgi:CDP-diglyceride synthetase
VQPLLDLQLLALLALANGTPVIAKKLLGARLACPLDFGIAFVDGRPLFGPSKTIRGIVLAVFVTGAGAAAIGLGTGIGLIVGAAAMAGDLCSSFLKRRLALPSSSRATGLDQIPESLFPLLGCRAALGLGLADIALGVVVFLVGEIVLSRVFYRLRLRDRPY